MKRLLFSLLVVLATGWSEQEFFIHGQRVNDALSYRIAAVSAARRSPEGDTAARFRLMTTLRAVSAERRRATSSSVLAS